MEGGKSDDVTNIADDDSGIETMSNSASASHGSDHTMGRGSSYSRSVSERSDSTIKGAENVADSGIETMSNTNTTSASRGSDHTLGRGSSYSRSVSERSDSTIKGAENVADSGIETVSNTTSRANADAVEVIVESMDNKTRTFDMSSLDTVLDLKTKVAKWLDSNPTQTHLIHEGKELSKEKNTLTLKSCGMTKRRNMVKTVTRLSGG